MDVSHALADGVDRSGDVEADASGQVASEQTPAQRPVGRIQPASLHPHLDVAGAGRRNGRLFQTQHVGRLAVRVEPDRPHGVAHSASKPRICYVSY
ncbi:MAG: hypothetical protein WDM85_03200 [Caulobacteraceae bacterium]